MTAVAVRVQGLLDEGWQEWLSGLEILHPEPGVTLLQGELPDQAAIYGLIARLRDLGLALISVQCGGIEQKLDPG